MEENNTIKKQSKKTNTSKKLPGHIVQLLNAAPSRKSELLGIVETLNISNISHARVIKNLLRVVEISNKIEDQRPGSVPEGTESELKIIDLNNKPAKSFFKVAEKFQSLNFSLQRGMENSFASNDFDSVERINNTMKNISQLNKDSIGFINALHGSLNKCINTQSYEEGDVFLGALLQIEDDQFKELVKKRDSVSAKKSIKEASNPKDKTVEKIETSVSKDKTVEKIETNVPKDKTVEKIETKEAKPKTAASTKKETTTEDKKVSA